MEKAPIVFLFIIYRQRQMGFLFFSPTILFHLGYLWERHLGDINAHNKDTRTHSAEGDADG